MNALKPRPRFQVLVMSEEGRLGRESIETAYALKQLVTGGVRVFLRTRISPTGEALERTRLRVRTGAHNSSQAIPAFDHTSRRCAALAALRRRSTSASRPELKAKGVSDSRSSASVIVTCSALGLCNRLLYDIKL